LTGPTALMETYSLPTEPQGFGSRRVSSEARRAMSIIPSRAGPLQCEQLAEVGAIARENARPDQENPARSVRPRGLCIESDAR
jgi:hypothetical protein